MALSRPVEDVLVLRALGLGDALTAVPALRGVRRAFPGARVTLAGPAGVGGWLRRQGVVDAVLDVDGLAAPPRLPWTTTGHVGVDLHGRGPASHHRLLATRPSRLVAFACPEAGFTEGPWWVEGEHEVRRWCRLVTYAGGWCGPDDLRLHPGLSAGPEPFPGLVGDVLLHPGAASGARRWPVERWVAVAQELVAGGTRVTLTGGAAEVGLCDEVVARTRPPSPALRVVSTAGTLDLDGLARLVAAASLVVCGDTGISHVATAVGTPSVLLLGPTSPDRWGPLLDVDRHTTLWHGDPDHPGDPHAAAPDPTLLRITVDEVVAAVHDQLARGPLSLAPAGSR